MRMTQAMKQELTPRNNAGGTTYVIDEMEYLDRFLILGTFENFYCSQTKITKEAIAKLIPLAKAHGEEMVARALRVSLERLAVKTEPVAIALAVAWKYGSEKVRSTIEAKFPEAFRIGTHLFEWVEAAEAVGCGYGRRMRRMLGSWYLAHAQRGTLEYQLAKYQQRNGWSHRDVLRLCHLIPTPETEEVLKWAVSGEIGENLSTIVGMNKLKHEPENAPNIIRSYRLTHEMVPTDIQNTPAVMDAMFDEMPYRALIRNLNRLTNAGVVAQRKHEVVGRLQDPDVIRKSGVHPFNVLLAWATYAQGKGFKGSLTWDPEKGVTSALESAFYKSLKCLPPSGKKYLLALDISGSMTSPIMHSPVTSAQAECAMVAAQIAAEGTENVDVVLFSDDLVEIDSRELHDRTIDNMWRTIARFGFGGTDASLAFKFATEKKRQYDAIVVYTDNESWGHARNMGSYLDAYRKISPNVKTISVAFALSEFSILPRHPNNLNVAGLSADLPAVITKFVEG